MFGLTGWKKSLFPIYCLVTMPVFASNLCPKTDVKSKKKYAILFIYDTVKMSQPNTKFSQVSTLFWGARKVQGGKEVLPWLPQLTVGGNVVREHVLLLTLMTPSD